MIKKAIRELARMAGLRVSRLQGGYDEAGLYTIHNDLFRQSTEFRAAYRRAMATV